MRVFSLIVLGVAAFALLLAPVQQALACPTEECAYSSEPDLAIPDGQDFEEECGDEDPECDEEIVGVCTLVKDTITIEGTGLFVTEDYSLDVNITHTWRGDIALALLSPAGTLVPLKEPDIEDNEEDVIGNYPNTLEALGELGDLIGQPLDGTWELWVGDCFERDTGTLNSWSIKTGEECAIRTFGDLDGDGELGREDFKIIKNHLGTVVGDENYSECADMNQDGEVSYDDLRSLARSIRAGGPPVPIPAVEDDV